MSLLVTIERLHSIHDHPNADNLKCGRVLEYPIVFNPSIVSGDRVVYARVDSVFPERFASEPWFHHDGRIRLVKLRGCPSYGMVFSLEYMQRYCTRTLTELPDGTNITDDLGVRKYYAPGELDVGPIPFPSFLKKTDQLRIQECSELLCSDGLFAVTVKYDGSSHQYFYHSGKVGCASRNHEIIFGQKEHRNAELIERRYNLFRILREVGKNISIQGELYGSKIQRNPHHLSIVDFAVFDILDLDTRTFWPFGDVISFCEKYHLPTVECLHIDIPLPFSTAQEWIEYADTVSYKGGYPAEGVVVKRSDGKEPYVSFKAVSEKYLMS